MTDDKVTEAAVVWGVPITYGPYGRRLWPDEIKAQVVDRVARGDRIARIAREIGANESLVAKWVKDAKAPTGGLAFVEVTVPTEARGVAAPVADGSSCHIRLGDVELTIRPGYPASHLAEVLRAVRASQ
ncbi:transposase [Rhodobacter sp. CZR27]|uniref:transposase n=1 Tax=Rhodobacter sp. CZR27 TaxID=2033869 RepID=UPI0012FD9B9C|nr:transposase [Rhodobacter sp. CZR27]